MKTSVRATGDGINQNLKKTKVKLFNREGPEKEKNRNLSSLVPSGGMLIVALKDQVEVWASEIRDLSHSRLLLYTDTLAKRRQIGAHNLAQYDVVITTFDVSELHHPSHSFIIHFYFSSTVHCTELYPTLFPLYLVSLLAGISITYSEEILKNLI